MYVLDRLLALQLGRPTAIYEADFQVELPSADDQSAFGMPGDEVLAQSSGKQRGCIMDYFVAMIRFSYIIGLVIRELYRPSQIDSTPDQMLQSSSRLDQLLTEWKANLPRHLRFDLGQTFDKSLVFRRQVSHFALFCSYLSRLSHTLNLKLAEYARREILPSARTHPPTLPMSAIFADEQPTFHESPHSK